MTRIKYTRNGDKLESNVFVNYEGHRFSVTIYPTKLYVSRNIGIRSFIIEDIEHFSIDKAKRIARSLLMDKYKVRLINEVRQK